MIALRLCALGLAAALSGAAQVGRAPGGGAGVSTPPEVEPAETPPAETSHPEGPAPDATAADAAPAEENGPPALASAPPTERLKLDELLRAAQWSRRAVALLRLERYGCEESRGRIAELLHDRAWQVRSFAVQALGRRGDRLDDTTLFDREDDPRVLRAALRYRYPVDLERLERGVGVLSKSPRSTDRMMAAELAAASGEAELLDEARDLTRSVILRMSRAEAGALSPRLAVLTGGGDLRTAYRWRRWLQGALRAFEVHCGYLAGVDRARQPPGLIARLEPERFSAFADYLRSMGGRSVDLAVCLDCTASMTGELGAAQGGIDDLMLFVGDIVGSLRCGLVAYRDRYDRFETKGWDLTSDLEEARRRLWQLDADGGGDTPESVYEAMSLAYEKLSWDPKHARVLVLVGDAPPHVGSGVLCVDLAKRGAAAGFVTHAIECKGEPVEHFAEIAEAGGGRCVPLEDDALLIPEIAGLTLGEAFEQEFNEFFGAYLVLCR